MNPEAVAEQVTCSWYDNGSTNRHPSNGATQAVYPKEGAYSWLKAPRYEGRPYETGPLARMMIGGSYRKGISVHDRHRARAVEAQKIAEALPSWLDEIKVDEPVYARWTAPAEAEAAGLTEAPRGALGHWLKIRGGKDRPLPGGHPDLLERFAPGRPAAARPDGEGPGRDAGGGFQAAGRGLAHRSFV